ncbi:hypothetical protein GEMRC1_002921 [Eukaryota sp. GEM-RC1]
MLLYLAYLPFLFLTAIAFTVDSFSVPFVNLSLPEPEHSHYFDQELFKHVVPTSIRVFNDQIFMSFPRLSSNSTPVTLASLDLESMTFSAFPSLKYNTPDSPAHLFSVNSFEITPNGFMWILDNGHLPGHDEKPSPKLVVYDINRQVTRRVAYLPSYMVSSSAFFSQIVIDSDRFIAYFTNSDSWPDEKNPSKGSLVMYSYENNVFSTLLSDDESVNSDNSVVIKAGSRQVYKDHPLLSGATSLALSCDFSTLFLCPLSSRKLYLLEVDHEVGNHSVVNLGSKGYASTTMISSNANYLYIADVEKSRLFKTFLRKSHKSLLPNQRDFLGTHPWPTSIALFKGKMYVLSNKRHLWRDGVISWSAQNFFVEVLDFEDPQVESYVYGCRRTPWAFKLEMYTVVAIVCVLLLVVYLMWIKLRDRPVSDGYYRV